MPRVIWKGAISFGLVHVPVALYPASSESGIDFDWIDKRSHDPVGYKRINKRTGKEVPSEQIVRGVKVGDDEYVLLDKDEIAAAYPKTTQTIEIESFVEPTQLPFTLLEKPYYLEPLPRGEKVYALLREAMLEAGVVGIARVVMHTKEHLATLVPAGPALMLNTLRWHEEVRPWTELKLPGEGRSGAGLKEAELKMARQLIQEMTEDWQPERYTDRFSAAIQALVDQRAQAGQAQAVTPLEAAPSTPVSNVVDLTALLAQSLKGRGNAGEKTARKADKPRAAAARKSSPRTSAAKSASRKRA
jgi:DNA end-binding protein Ku